MKTPISRRRFITISAGTLAAGLFPGADLMARPLPVRWRGTAMGAEAELILSHPNRNKARRVLRAVQDEIRRLEKVFSLYDPESALSRLNKAGHLEQPPLDLIRCLDDAAAISRITDGAFDSTVQPLWNLYARHFAKNPASSDGPHVRDIKLVRKLIDYKAVQIDSRRVSFTRPGMAITLNGIAQGYVTDRVAELLKTHGFNNVLINLGETRGLGHRKDGTPWRVGIKAPDDSTRIFRKVALDDKAIATSGGYGTRFSENGAHHHLFDPKTGHSANLWSSVSVIANDATLADALSTAFSSLDETRIRRIAKALNVAVIVHDGTKTTQINT